MAALQISRKVDYALRALIYLARHDGERTPTLGTIAADIDVSPQFLAKIVEELAHRGLVRSRRGARGGYVLGRSAAEISFNDVIEAVEGPIALNICLDGQGDCTLLGACGMQPVWQEAQRRLVDIFAHTTLADVGTPCRGGGMPAGAPNWVRAGTLPAGSKALGECGALDKSGAAIRTGAVIQGGAVVPSGAAIQGEAVIPSGAVGSSGAVDPRDAFSQASPGSDTRTTRARIGSGES